MFIFLIMTILNTTVYYSKFMKWLLFSLVIVAFVDCNLETKETASYHFPYIINQPTAQRQLPSYLKEVSGLSILSETPLRLACIQDEVGALYSYDWTTRQTTIVANLNISADFEGIEVVPPAVFMLTSRGDLYKLSDFNDAPVHQKFNFRQSPNFEGLGYDALKNQLLIIPKAELTKGKMFVFGYDVVRDQFNYRPMIELSNKDIKRYCKNNGIDYKKQKQFPFAPSGIARHPLTGNYYILAAQGGTLCVISPQGRLLHLAFLDTQIYPQPEGITFTTNGDLYIASEGDEVGYLMQFKIKN